MKKILAIIFVIFICATLCFGQIIVAQAQQEWMGFYNEFNNALRQFTYIAAS